MAWKVTSGEKIALQKVRDTAMKAWVEYTEALHDADRLREAYLEQRRAVLAKVEEIGERLREEYNDKSETWQESDKGAQVNEFIDNWLGVEVDDVDEIYIPDGDPLDEALDNLPEEI